ncbi:MAG: tetratricopeptide repeat protein [Bacteroidales bacterium]
MKWTNVSFLICIFLCATLSTKAVKGAEEDVFFVPDSLYENGDFFEASIALERIIYMSEDPRERVLANLKKADALKQMGDFARARRDLQRSMTYRADDALQKEVLYQLAFCAFMDGDYEGANGILMQVRHAYEDLVSQRFLLLEGMVMVEQSRWEELRRHVVEWVEKAAEHPGLLDEVKSRYDSLMDDPGPPEMKNPERARLLSTFLPGAGQIYAGETGWGLLNAASQLTGLAAFGVLAWQGYYMAGIFAGLGSFQAFYFGGIRQAGDFAEEYNNSRLESFRAAMGEFLLYVADVTK